MKRCSLCRQSKPLSEFYTNGPGKHYAHCKPCALARIRARASWPEGYRPVMATARMDVSVDDLLRSATPEPNTGCWLWTRLYRPNGYPRLRFRLKDWPVSRIMWTLSNRREIPRGMVVRHTCDNPGCINPDHLLVGTCQDNTDDAVRRGRLWAGFADLARKLTPDMRGAAIELSRMGLPDTTVAKALGVTSPVIQRLRRDHGIEHHRWDRSRAAVERRSVMLSNWKTQNRRRIDSWSVAP